MKIYFAIVLFLIFCAVDHAANAQSVSIDATVQVVNLQDFEIEPNEAGTITEVYSTLWWAKQCCIQDRSRRGIISRQCEDPKIIKLIQGGFCEAVLKE